MSVIEQLGSHNTLTTIQLPNHFTLLSSDRAEHHFVGSEPNKATQRNNVEASARVKEAWSKYESGDRYGAYYVGDALHGYADTFSHEGFTAWHNDEINKRTGSGRPNTGHADAEDGGYRPDRPYNDVKKAIEAAKGIYDLIPDAKGGKVLPWSEVEKDLTKAFSFDPKEEDPGRNEMDRIINMRDVTQERFGERPLYSKSKFDSERRTFEKAMKRQTDERTKKQNK